MPWLLYTQRKSPWYPLDRRLGGPQSCSGHSGEEKNSQTLLRLELLIIRPIAQHHTTELSQLGNNYFSERNVQRFKLITN
jgi:hypothetical protein